MSEVLYNNVITTGILDRGIYESLDSVRNHKRQQELHHTGSVSVKNRRHRAVQVCLWLLCVLLLTAVIVLCVYFTTDRKHLLTHNYNLTKEREKLLIENTEILNQNRNLTEEKEKLHSDITELNRWLTEQDRYSDNFKWIYYNFSFYYISSELKSWNDSRRDCKQREADLVIINSKEEQEFMQNATAGYRFDPFWIGLKNKDGVWKWIDETTLTTSFWIDTYPRYKNHYCARTSLPGWSDFSCDDMYRWICEKKILKSLTI